MKTWKFELAFVALILIATVVLTGAPSVEWIGSLAVLAGFAHAQVASRLAEREATKVVPDVECHSLASGYYGAKEVLWVAYFVLHHSYAALVGCAAFIAYPMWRALWRKWYPLERAA